MNIYELRPPDSLSLSVCTLFLLDLPVFTEDIYFKPTSGVHQTCGSMLTLRRGLHDICEVEEEECIVSL